MHKSMLDDDVRLRALEARTSTWIRVAIVQQILLVGLLASAYLSWGHALPTRVRAVEEATRTIVDELGLDIHGDKKGHHDPPDLASKEHSADPKVQLNATFCLSELDDQGKWSQQFLTIHVGDTVEWTWAHYHNVIETDAAGSVKAGGISSGGLALSGSFTHGFTVVGTYYFKSEALLTMTCTVEAAENDIATIRVDAPAGVSQFIMGATAAMDNVIMEKEHADAGGEFTLSRNLTRVLGISIDGAVTVHKDPLNVASMVRSADGSPLQLQGHGGVKLQSKTSFQVHEVGAQGKWSQQSLTVYVGDTVAWTWTNYHNVIESDMVGNIKADGISSGGLALSGAFLHTFDTAGTYVFKSQALLTMTCTVEVIESFLLNNGTLTVGGDVEVGGSLRVGGIDIAELQAEVKAIRALYSPPPPPFPPFNPGSGEDMWWDRTAHEDQQPTA